MRIPFSQSEHPAGDGPLGRRCEAILEHELGAPRVLLTPSGTAALELAALLLEVDYAEEVIVPAFTFPSTASAFALRGARIRFCDIRPDTLNLDEQKALNIVNTKTAAIVPVHYAGVGCEMDAFDCCPITLVEDNAQGLFGTYQGKRLGSFGDLAALSFHATKNITCGEGGALVINNPELIERAEVIRDKGCDRRAYERRDVDAYTWKELGSSWVLAEELAHTLLGQLERRHEIQAARHDIWWEYQQELAEWATVNGIRQPVIPDECGPSWHLYYLLLPSEPDRKRFICHLAERDIQAVFHYQPLNRSRMGMNFGDGPCPVAEDVAKRIVRLPMWVGMPQEQVIDAVLEFKC